MSTSLLQSEDVSSEIQKIKDIEPIVKKKSLVKNNSKIIIPDLEKCEVTVIPESVYLDENMMRNLQRVKDKTLDMEPSKKRKNLSKNNSKVIFPDLEKCDIPDEIKNKAIEIYKNLTSITKKEHPKVILMIRCVFQGSILCNMAMDRNVLGEKLKIKKSENKAKTSLITKALKLKIEDLSDGSELHIEDFFNYYLSSLGLQEYLEEIKTTSLKITNHPTFLKKTGNKFKFTLAAGVLLYSLEKCKIDIPNFSQVIGKSGAGITETKNIIESIFEK